MAVRLEELRRVQVLVSQVAEVEELAGLGLAVRLIRQARVAILRYKDTAHQVPHKHWQDMEVVADNLAVMKVVSPNTVAVAVALVDDITRVVTLGLAVVPYSARLEVLAEEVLILQTQAQEVEHGEIMVRRQETLVEQPEAVLGEQAVMEIAVLSGAAMAEVAVEVMYIIQVEKVVMEVLQAGVEEAAVLVLQVAKEEMGVLAKLGFGHIR